MSDAALYPEYTREQLEAQYHLMVAALWQAAQEAVGPEDRGACGRQIEAWLVASEDSAVKSGAVRLTRNRCMAMARAMAGPVH